MKIARVVLGLVALAVAAACAQPGIMNDEDRSAMPELSCDGDSISSTSGSHGGIAEPSHAAALATFIEDAYPELDPAAFALAFETPREARYDLVADGRTKAFFTFKLDDQSERWTDHWHQVCGELLGPPEPIEDSSAPPRDLYGDEY